MKYNTKKVIILIIVKTILFIAVSVFTIHIFYNLCYFGDVQPHAERAEAMQSILLKGPVYFFSHTSHTYPMWHILYLLIREALSPLHEKLALMQIDSLFLCASLTSMVTIICLYLSCEYTFKKMLPGKEQNIAFLLAWMLIFAGPYYIKKIHGSYYLGQGIIVPWHNPTTLAVYPIGILCFELYFFLAQVKKDRVQWKKWIVFSALLMLSCLAKPSFYQMFIPGIALYCLVELLLSKGKRFLFCVYSLVSVLPTCCVALLQLKAEVHEPEQLVAMAGTWESTALMAARMVREASYGVEIGGIGIEWLKVQRIMSPEAPILSLLLLWVFPAYIIVIYIINRKRNIKMSLPLYIAGSGTLQYLLLYLPMRPETGDFAWGYYMSMAILFIGCITYFIEICNEKGYKSVKWIGWGLFLGHVFWGGYYAVRLSSHGFNYMSPLF